MSLGLSGVLMEMFLMDDANLCTIDCAMKASFRVILFWGYWSLLFLLLALASSYSIVKERIESKRRAWQRTHYDAEYEDDSREVMMNRSPPAPARKTNSGSMAESQTHSQIGAYKSASAELKAVGVRDNFVVNYNMYGSADTTEEAHRDNITFR
jgi:hypothetical protein